MAAQYAGQLGSVRAWLHGRGVTAVSDAWLAECLEYVGESCSGVRLSAADLHQHVLDQWLAFDLASIGAAALPPRLADTPHTTLRQPCAVQLLSAVDVGQPAHGQLLRLRRLDSANTDVTCEPRAPWEPRPSRALRLALTDGVQTVTALECEPLPALRASAAAGLKLLLWPPLECRRGVILLAAESVSVLGGVVEELQVPHAEQRVLEERLGAAAAGLPAGPADDDSGYRSESAPDAARGRPVAEPDPFDDGLDEAELAALDIPDDVDDAELAALDMPGDDAGVGDAAAVGMPFDDVDDAELASLDLDSLVDTAVDEATAREPVTAPAKRRRTEPCDGGQPRRTGTLGVQSRPPRSLDGAVSGSARLNKPAPRQQVLDAFVKSGAPPARSAQSTRPIQLPPRPAPLPSPPRVPPVPPAPSAARPARTTASPVRAAPSFDLSSWFAPAAPAPAPAPAARPPAPFGYLTELRPGRPLTVKAFIMTLTGGLSTAGGRWSVAVKINDGTRSTNAVLSHAVLVGMIGLSVTEADALRVTGRADPADRGKLKRALSAAQNAIIRLSCLMRLEVGESGDDLPVITEVTEVGVDTLRTLRACVDAG